jgi:drug/metabolite transporter (DMT)-like permease
MSATALVLVLISAVAHAAWNFTGKKSSPTLAFFFWVTVAGSLLFAPLLTLFTGLLGALDREILQLLALTGLFQGLYLGFLAAAYHAGDMSIAYPIARSSPLIIVCISAFVLGQSDTISVQAVFGIILIVGGCLLVPMRSFSDLHLANYRNRTTTFAICAAFATAGYSLVDAEATARMRVLTNPLDGAPIATALEVALVYVILQGISASVWMALFVAVSDRERRRLAPLLRGAWRPAIATAVLMFGTYGLVILSMAYVSNVSYVVALRQFSIPLGVVMGVVGLGERLHAPKLLGVAVTVGGLLAVALG